MQDFLTIRKCLEHFDTPMMHFMKSSETKGKIKSDLQIDGVKPAFLGNNK